jgi:hypothetical protein
VWACAYLAESGDFEEHCDFTAGSGLYAINGLVAGEYKIEFWPEAAEPSYVGEFYDDKPFWEEADEVEVKEATATTGIDAELAEGGTIEGEVRAALLGGPVKSADVIVCAALSTGGTVGCALTRSDGTYTLPGLPADEYTIQFVPSFDYNLLNQFYDHKSELAEADPLAVAAGETKTEIDADLEAGAEIHGTVYSAATGAPLPKVPVCALFFETVLETWLPRICVPTSSAGGYQLYSLFAAPYKVVFSPEVGREFFGESGKPESDGYFTQYFNGETTLEAAGLLPMTPPGVMTGVDGRLQPEHAASLLPSPSVSPAITVPAIAPARKRRKARLRCRPGFQKKRVSGKRRCVRIRKHRHQHRNHV